MNRTEFIQTLQGRLAQTMDPNQVAEHIRYYDAYITEQIENGMDEEEVLDRLGDPLLIAKTIMDTSEQKNERDVRYENREESDREDREDWEETGRAPDIRQTRISAQGGCLLAAIIVVLVITLVLWLVGSVISFLLPVLVPVLIIVLVIAYFKQR